MVEVSSIQWVAEFDWSKLEDGLIEIKSDLKRVEKNTQKLNKESKKTDNIFKSILKTFKKLTLVGAVFTTGFSTGLLATMPALAAHFERFKLAFFLAGMELSNRLAPAFDVIIQGIEKFFRSDMWGKIVDFIGEVSLGFAEWFGNIINNEDAWNTLSMVVDGFIGILWSVWDILKKINEGFEKYTGEDIFGNLIQGVEALSVALVSVSDALDSINLALEGKVGKFIELYAGILGYDVRLAFEGLTPTEYLEKKATFPSEQKIMRGYLEQKEKSTQKTTNISIFNQIENLRGVDDVEAMVDTMSRTISNYYNITGTSV